LAQANHLKPSYLRRYLCAQYGGYTPRLDRLAAVSGRSVTALEHVFVDNAPARRAKPTPHIRRQARSRAVIYRAIRRDAQTEGLSIRALAERHHVHRRTVREALVSPRPRPRKPPPPRATLLDPFKAVVEALITQDLATVRIWDHLLDHHDVEMSYSALRDYVVNRQRELRRTVR
jgi:transposase